MSQTYVNYHMRSTDADAVARLVENIIVGRAFVSPAVNGWVTIYDEVSQSLDPIEIDRLATEFSRGLETALFTFLIAEDDVFAYYLFDSGDLIDEYNSTPDLFGPISDQTRLRWAGHPVVVLKYCSSGTELIDVQWVLASTQAAIAGGFASSTSAHDRAHRLASLLGIDPDHAISSFDDLQMNLVPHANQYAKIETRRYQRPLRRPIPPRLPPRNV